jgi:hypothetical protein
MSFMNRPGRSIHIIDRSIAPVLITTAAARDRLLIPAALTALPAWASPFGDGSTRAAAATLPEPTSGLRAFA